MLELLYDEKVLPSIVELAEEAREQLVLISPYNDFSVTLRDVVEQTARRVSVIAICRSDQAQKEKAHLEWLIALGAEVLLVERLHSEIYMNESSAIVTSMNLLQGSAVNSKEIAFRVQDTENRKKIFNYVRQRLIATAELYEPAASRPQSAKPSSKPVATSAPQIPEKPDTAGLLTIAGKAVFGAIKRGLNGGHAYCIRCESSISFDLGRPLCDECYDTWAYYSNRDYQEKYCHRCRREWQTSYARPLCRGCYEDLPRN